MKIKGQNRELITLIMLFVALLPTRLFAQKEYLDEVFQIIEMHSIKKDSIDFDRIRGIAYSKLNGVNSTQGCYPIIRFILSELNDHHSFLMEKTEVDKWRSTSQSSDFLQLPPPYTGKVLNNEIGYVQMQGFSSGDSVSTQEYASKLQNLIKSLDGKDIRGWIIDLRQNTGGNCWPMLTGLGPLIGNGICGYFIDSDRNKVPWYYNDGEAGEDSKPLCKIKGAPYKLLNKRNPIAVLTGSWTASSGEVVVVSFRGKTNSKSFGENTAGLSTGNANYSLSDGSMLFLTTSIYADRNGNTFGDKIKPDVIEHFEKEEINSDNDPVIRRAIDWISNYK